VSIFSRDWSAGLTPAWRGAAGAVAPRAAPERAALNERVLAIQPKRFEREVVTFLTDQEVEAILAAPDGRSFGGRRDHCLSRSRQGCGSPSSSSSDAKT
jgi:hypothetical protein